MCHTCTSIVYNTIISFLTHPLCKSSTSTLVYTLYRTLLLYLQDLPSARSPSELEKCLALSDFGPGQMWHLEPACAVTGEGLDMALDAIHELIVKRRKQKKRARNKTR